MLIPGGTLTRAEGIMTVRMRRKDEKTRFGRVRIKSEIILKAYCLARKQKYIIINKI